MAEPASGAQAGFRGHDLMQQFVGMQSALHQQFGLAFPDQRDSTRGGGVAVRGRLDAQIGDVDIELVRRQRGFWLRGRPGWG